MSEQAASGQVSPDGQFVWDGEQWRPIARWTWAPTNGTRPLQYSVALYLFLYALFEAASPLLFATEIRDQVRRQAEASPSIDPNQVDAMVNLGVTVGILTGLVVGTVLLVFAILSAVRRITWVFYADLVLLALFGGLGSIGELIGLATGATAANPIQAVLGIGFALAGLGLFAWALVARLSRGVWAGRRQPVPA